MAWGVKKVEDQRKKFCKLVLNDELNIAEACRCFNISRPTGYHWLERYQKEGDEGLKNQSTARHSQNQAVPDNIIKKILLVKARFKDFGEKIQGS